MYVILRVQEARARVIMVRVLNTRGRVNTLNKNLLGLYCTWRSKNMYNPLSDFYSVEFYTIASLAAKSETGPPHGQPRQLTLALGLQLTGINTQMMQGMVW